MECHGPQTNRQMVSLIPIANELLVTCDNNLLDNATRHIQIDRLKSQIKPRYFVTHKIKIVETQSSIEQDLDVDQKEQKVEAIVSESGIFVWKVENVSIRTKRSNLMVEDSNLGIILLQVS